MKTYVEFITEVSAKIVGQVDLSKNRSVTTFGPRKKSKKKSTFSSKKGITLTPEQKAEIEQVIIELDKIASGSGGTFDRVAVRGHLKDRIHERGFKMSDLVTTFKNIKRKTSFFDDLKELSRVGLIGWKSKRYGPQILDTKKKIQFGTAIAKSGTNIVIRTVLGEWKPKDQQSMKQVCIKHFYAA